jgi:hypothetical protein
LKQIERTRQIEELRKQIEDKQREIEVIGDATKVTAMSMLKQGRSKTMRTSKCTPDVRSTLRRGTNHDT